MKNGKKNTMMKLCKICGEKKRYGNLTKCYYCWREATALKKKEKDLKKKERKERTKKFQESIKKALHNKAWRMQGQFLKNKSKNFQDLAECFTCFKLYPAKELEQGHRHHGKLDFDLRNIHLQCVRCNHYLSGNLGNYERRLIEENGIEFAKKLEADANQHQGYTIEELKEIIKLYE